MRVLVMLWLLSLSLFGQVPDPVALTPNERAYLQKLGKVTLCVDPDWVPFEHIDEKGRYEGIAADLLARVSERLGIPFELVPTRTWEESLENSRKGKCLILGFLNQTRAREEWLLFTEPLFTDPNVFITREEHAFIADPAELRGESIVLPRGTGVEEWIKSEYPNLNIKITETEREAIEMVSQKKADMTMRSLIIAAYTIRKEGLFNLKIAGQFSKHTNYLRVGVVKDEPLLRDILNRAILTITPQERGQIVNKHVGINVQGPVDYRLIMKVVAGFAFIILLVVLWNHRLSRLNTKLEASIKEVNTLQGELQETNTFLSAMIENSGNLIFVKDLEGRYELVNKRWEEVTGLSREAVLGRTDVSIFPPEIGVRYRQLDLEVMGQGEVTEEEEVLPGPSGTRYFLSTKFPLRNPDLSVRGLCGMSTEITQRKLAEVKIQELAGQLELERDYAQASALRDGLTHLANRRRFDDALSTEFYRLQRSGGPLSLILLDVDHFKKFNDHYGHLAGDDCLRRIAQALDASVVRASDLAARYGGEEFTVILPDTPQEGAGTMAERIRKAVEDLAIPHEKNLPGGCVTVSLGVATRFTARLASPEKLTELADAALYKAKEAGRNRFEHAPNDSSGDGEGLTLNRLTWRDSADSGNPLIDAQHRNLLEASNALLSSMLEEHPKESSTQLLEVLLREVVAHFREEETIIKASGYPKAEQHAQIHADLVAKALELAQRFREDDLGVGELFSFLAHEVVAQHFFKEDLKFFPYLGKLPGH